MISGLIKLYELYKLITHMLDLQNIHNQSGNRFILAFTLLFYFLSNKNKAEEAATPLIEETAQETALVPSGGASAPTGVTKTQPVKEPEIFVPVEKSREIYAKQIARLFVERFTTFSNQNGNTHIDDVLILATPQMGKWIETQKIKAAAEYHGVTTSYRASFEYFDNNASVKGTLSR